MELEKKFIVEYGRTSNPDLAIVYGTSSKQNFNVKKRDQIIGYSFMTRVPLNFSGLFDNFDDAVIFYKTSVERKRNMWKDYIKSLDEDLKKLAELEAMLKA